MLEDIHYDFWKVADEVFGPNNIIIVTKTINFMINAIFLNVHLLNLTK